MIYSMTGYGKFSQTLKTATILVEMRSLNSKGLELNIKIPTVYRSKEFIWRQQISGALERGKVDATISIEDVQVESQNMMNIPLLESYIAHFNELADKQGIPKDGILQAAMMVPGVIQTAGTQEMMYEKEIELCIQKAIEDIQKFRKDEGQKLYIEIGERVKLIGELMHEIKKLAPIRIQNIREQLKSNIQLVLHHESIDVNRMEEELFYYLEKLDITEELVRLEAHCDYFTDVLNETIQSKGRKLNFISQEMGREINTIGSKANHKEIQVLVVQMKDELEKIKEQLNNIL